MVLDNACNQGEHPEIVMNFTIDNISACDRTETFTTKRCNIPKLHHFVHPKTGHHRSVHTGANIILYKTNLLFKLS